MNTQNTLDANKLREGFDHFYAPRQEGDIDLIALVRYALEHIGLQDRIEEGFTRHPLIIEATNKQPSVQRWLLNRYWVLQLINTNLDTMRVRLYLIQDGTEEDWMRLFVEHVLPFVAQNGLPKPIHSVGSSNG